MNSSYQSTTATTSFYKLKNIVQTLSPQHFDERQELIKIKSEWRLMHSNEMFQDYIFLREAFSTRILQQEETIEPKNRRTSIIFSGPFKQQLQKKKLEQLKRISQIKSISQLNDHTPLGRAVSKSHIDEVIQIADILYQNILVEQLENIAPILEQMVIKSKESGIVSFYFLALYIQTQTQFLYCRRREGYIIWKRFLRTCNIQGKRLMKFKLVAYRQLSKCCLDLADFERAQVYLKKMLKLSWVMKDRNYEILAYDLIAMLFYYKGDVDRAQFFHNKFAIGDYESFDSNVRLAGITDYLTMQRMKLQQNDQDSMSLDDLDLDVIIQKDNIKRWQKGLPVFDSRKVELRRVIVNQWSCNRDLTIHLIHKEKLRNKGEEIGFLPLNPSIKKLIKFYLFDLRYYLRNGNLFNFD
ncbi:hypothetical protein pb186bvf_019692 [Paramecium bursaria]